MARDTVALGQRGCNSPHTIFVERGGELTPAAFAALLGEELRVSRAPGPLRCRAAGSIPDPELAGGVRHARQAWYSDEGVRWSVFYSDEDRGLATPCYGRTLFVRPVDNVFDVAALCSVNTQTAGLALG